MNCVYKKPLFNDLDSLYTGAICHKQYFLFLNPNHNEVLIYDFNLKNVGCIKTEKYQSITDNKKSCYFILTKADCQDFLYITTYDFLEFDCIKLNIPLKYKEKINDIYYDEDKNRIYVTTINYVYSITLDGYFIKEEHSSLKTYEHKIIRNLNGCCMPSTSLVNNCFSYTAVGKCQVPYISYIKNNEAFFATLKNDECKNDICLGEDIKVVSIFVCRNKLYLLIIKCNKYNYLYELDIKCNECHVNELPCCKHLNCEEKCHHHCKDPVACILESVALEQAALSHILNAEGEKIQKAVAMDTSICDLLKINKSVSETIFNTTMLEHALQEKIDKVLQYECKKKC